MNAEENIYSDEHFSDVDIGLIMRVGHPDIEEGDEHIVAAIRRLQETLGRPLRIIVVGDELCPEYLTAADQERLLAAERIDLIDGYIFDNDADRTAYRESGVVPEWNLQLEEARRRALWSWYKFVGDFAIANKSWDVL